VNEFTNQVVSIIQNIPIGKVMTYGQIAKYAGNPWGARQVVRILNSMSTKYLLPWHRVINAKGEISLLGEGGSLQKSLLVSEGIIFLSDKIDLSSYQFFPQYNE
jgi:methylated-DNA-protein-cysteine methyltransferase-like protein